MSNKPKVTRLPNGTSQNEILVKQPYDWPSDQEQVILQTGEIEPPNFVVATQNERGQQRLAVMEPVPNSGAERKTYLVNMQNNGPVINRSEKIEKSKPEVVKAQKKASL